MKKRIRGSSPRTYLVGAPQGGFGNFKAIFGHRYEGQTLVAPEGEVLVVPEHGGWGSSETTRHQFPAGTKFRIVDVGDAYNLAVTDVFIDE